MPAVIAPHIILRQNLRAAVDHTLVLDLRLEAVIAIKTTQPSGIFHGKIDHSQPPWAAAVANCILDLHADSRTMEEWLRIAQKLPQRDRGGSTKNTAKALLAVLRLCENANDETVKEYTHQLNKWCFRAQIALGQTEPPRRIPRLPGEPEPACPWCKNHTLRMLPLDGLIKCMTPRCVDEEGRRPEARMEYSPHVGDFVMVWQDGVAGVPA